MFSQAMAERSRSIGRWLLYGLIIGPALAIGGTRSDVQLTMAVIAFSAALATGLGQWRSWPTIPWPAWWLLGLAFVTAVQTIPMPIAWLEILSPQAVALYQAYDPSVQFAALSVDSVATSRTAIFHLVAAVILAVCATQRRRYRRPILTCIILVASACALIALIHALFNMTQIYGVYPSIHRRTLAGMIGPFMNENTQASLLNLGAFIAVGMLGDGATARRRRLIMVAACLCIGVVFLSESRGAQVGLVAGWIFFCFVSLYLSDERSNTAKISMRQILSYGSGVIVIGVVGLAVKFDELRHYFFHRPSAELKFLPLDALTPWITHYPWTGSGRGSFISVYPHYQPQDLNGTVTHPENIVMQYLSEWGLLVGGIALVGWLMIIGRSFLINRSYPTSTTWGLWAGLLVVLAQQLVDFGLESLGLFAPIAVAIGVLFGSSSRTQSRAAPYFWGLSITTLGVGLIAWGPNILHQQHDKHLHEVSQLADNPAKLLETGRALAMTNPADYHVATTMAATLAKTKPFQQQAFMAWTNHAMRLFPNGGRIHHLAGQTLVANGLVAQGAGEYRRAFEKQPWLRTTLAKEILDIYADGPFLTRAFGSSADGQRLMFDGLFRRRAYSTIVELCQAQLLWTPNHLPLRLYQSRALLALKKFDALDKERLWFLRHGHHLDALAVGAQSAALQGRTAEAQNFIQEGLRAGGDTDAHYLRRAIQAYQTLGDLQSARRALDQLWTATRSDRTGLYETLALRVRVEQRIGDPAKALAALDRLQLVYPSAASTDQAARILQQMNDRKSALARVRKGLKRWPTSKVLHRRLRALEQSDTTPTKSGIPSED
ncbi:MAG: O-antigen ligase family protein [Myxococcota bacterium]|nr:O-antigen ligase family protein [Myxococcota bacterium]